MDLSSCERFGDCDFHKLSFDQIFRLLVIDDGFGCPTFKTNSASAGSGATEATLQQVLSSLNNGKEFETVLVKDTGASDLIIRQVLVYNEVAGTFNPPIYYTLAGVLYSPVGALEYVDNSLLLQNILTAVATTPRTPNFISDTVSVIPQNTPTGIVSFSLMFRGNGGQLNGANVPDGYSISFGNGKDPINTSMTYLRPTSGVGQEVLISKLT